MFRHSVTMEEAIQGLGEAVLDGDATLSVTRIDETPYWTAQVNDLVGGFIVTNFPHPLSEHDVREGRVTVACECTSGGMAELIAKQLNRTDDGRKDR